MTTTRQSFFGGWLVGIFLLSGVLLVGLKGLGADILPPGFRPMPLGVHALIGGKIVIRPGEVLESGTIVIRGDLIRAVGKDILPPPEARLWDMKGMTIYAGFIDAYLMLGASNAPVSTVGSEPISSYSLTAGGANFYGVPGQKTDRAEPGPGYEVARISPQYRAARDYSPQEKMLAPLRELGFTAGVIAPSKGIIRGTGPLVALTEENPNELILKPDVFEHVAFETPQGDERAYPSSLMGIIATLRQSCFDAHHYALDHADYQKNPHDRKRPEFDPALEALGPAINKKMRVAFEPGSALMVDRAALVARELGLDFCLVSCGQEWRRPDLAKTTGATFICPLNLPTLPKLPNETDWDQVSLDQLRSWDWAPENPVLLRQQGLEIALTTYGLSDKKKFRQNLRTAMDRGLSETDALAALTTAPAKLCGVEDRLGAIEAGKLAYLTVVDHDSYFNEEAKVREVWVDGRIYRSPAEEPKAGGAEENKLGTPASPEEAQPAQPKQEKKPSPKAANEEKPADSLKDSEPAQEKKDKRKEQLRELQKTRVARPPLEQRGPITNPPALLIRDGTIWTCGADGVLPHAQLLVSEGKIQAVGNFKGELRADTLVIDGSGLHVTPGLIDCHSHTAILGAVNESSLPSTAMVRIRDVVNSETENLYQQLAGGVTTVNLLHGSANPIGGQNCVIKLRDGASPDKLIFEAAPAGIKFALGENVKQSNWGDRFVTRFPQTRMGVRTFIANRFAAAQQYLKDWEAYRKGQSSTPQGDGSPGQTLAGQAGGTPGLVEPRRDLELEAIGEILQGNRWIHCHAYRQDEILMLIRLMEGFNVKIGTFQHVLEGYKIADEIARHGAGASAFADWWAYKFEVYDAIPYNGSLMHDRGVVVSFNSDSSELARRLYAEAAKAVKYGGMTEAEALKFVTLNPAQQLRIAAYVGSLEPGKDADFAIWSKPPLDSETVCLQTWIEGKKYFDRSLSGERTAKLETERADLLAKAKKISKLSSGGGENDSAEKADDSFFRVSLEHEFDGRERHCMDE